ncbi:MAG: flagellar type III secretion system pore protein FliP [Defluviitaleaceae bacterium]|nr:flagellar type III secretion system pore protein FliP [Defluviitaleaceae bacterium]
MKKIIGFVLMAVVLVGFFSVRTYGAQLFPGFSPLLEGTDDPEEVVSTLQVFFLVSLIALAPSLLVLLSGFTRIVIVLSFGRQAMATQQMPPNQVLVGIAIFLTIFIMTPYLSEINENALQPFGAGEMSIEEALDAAMVPIRRFMFRQLDTGTGMGLSSLELFHNLADIQMYEIEDVPNYILIPAFVVNELMIAFIMGFLIYVPFIVIDMVVASVLMSMGMMMLPPAMISMPFKIMVFILAGGWEMLIQSLMVTFNPDY